MITLTGEHNIASLANRQLEAASITGEPANYVISQPRLVRFELPLSGGQVALELTGSGYEPSRLWRALGAVKRLGALPENWDSYGAKPLQVRAVRRWVELVMPVLLAEDVPDALFVPTADGGLQLEWHHDAADVEITVPPTGAIEFLVVDALEGEREGNFTPDVVLPVLRRMAPHLT